MNDDTTPTPEQVTVTPPSSVKKQPIRRRTRIIIAAAAVLLVAIGVVLFVLFYLTPQADKAAREYKKDVATQLGDYIFADTNKQQYDAITSTPVLQKPLGAAQLSAEYRDAQNIQKSYNSVINEARSAGKELLDYGVVVKLPTTLSTIFAKKYDIGEPIDFSDVEANRKKNTELVQQARDKATEIHNQAVIIKELNVADKYKATLNTLSSTLQSMADKLNQVADSKDKQIADRQKNTQERDDLNEKLKQNNSPEETATLKKKLVESQNAGTKLLYEAIDINAKIKTLANEYGELSNKVVPDLRAVLTEFKQDNYVDATDARRDAAYKRVDQIYSPLTAFDKKAKNYKEAGK